MQACSYTGQQKLKNDSKAHRAPVEVQINSSSVAAVQDSKGLSERRVRSACSGKDMEKEISEDVESRLLLGSEHSAFIVTCHIGLLSSAKRNVDKVDCRLV